MVGQDTSLAFENCDVPGSSKPAQEPINQQLPSEKIIKNAGKLQEINSHSFVETSTSDPVAAADVQMWYANEINRLKRGLDREHKTKEYFHSARKLWKTECSRLR